MTSAEDELKIFLNLMAQSPDGLGDPQLIGKFAKAKAFLHAQQSLEQMNSQNIAPVMPNQSVTATNAPLPDQSTAQPSTMHQNDPNQPLPQSEGSEAMKLP